MGLSSFRGTLHRHGADVGALRMVPWLQLTSSPRLQAGESLPRERVPAAPRTARPAGQAGVGLPALHRLPPRARRPAWCWWPAAWATERGSAAHTMNTTRLTA